MIVIYNTNSLVAAVASVELFDLFGSYYIRIRSHIDYAVAAAAAVVSCD